MAPSGSLYTREPFFSGLSPEKRAIDNRHTAEDGKLLENCGSAIRSPTREDGRFTGLEYRDVEDVVPYKLGLSCAFCRGWRPRQPEIHGKKRESLCSRVIQKLLNKPCKGK